MSRERSFHGHGHGLALVLAGTVVAVWAGLMTLSLAQARLPADAAGLVLAAFPPGMPDSEAFAAVVRAGGEPVRTTWLGFVWVARGGEKGFVGRLLEAGAIAAFSELPAGPGLGGCAVGSVDMMLSPLLRPDL
jgi:hypothetical protein